jgi:hypothetical protein
MDSLKALPRVQKLYVATGGLVVFLVALLALHWAGSVKATQLNTWWIPLVLTIVAGGYFLSEILGFTMPVAGLTASRAFAVTFLVFFWTLMWFLEAPSRAVGAWLGLVSSAVATSAAWLVSTD